MSFALTAIALIGYSAVLWLLYGAIYSQQPVSGGKIVLAGLFGGIAHLAAALMNIFAEGLTDFSLLQSASLILAVTVTLVAVISLRHPLHTVLAIVVPPAALLLIATLFASPTKVTSLPSGTAAHIVFSVLAYGVITIAACCALTLYYGNLLLKRKQIGSQLRLLPPMETIDKLLFEMIIAGEILLSLSILSGLFFVENFFSQHLIHKTFFSLLSWVIFGVLLIGHYRFGWRGAKAIKWTLAGFAALLLAYIGSEFVIQWVLG